MDPSAFCRDFPKTIAVGGDFLLVRRNSANPHEQALDGDGTEPDRIEDIVENPPKGDLGYVHQLVILFGPGVEFCPNLAIVPVPWAYRPLLPPSVKQKGVCENPGF